MSIELVAWVIDNVRLDLIQRSFPARSGEDGLVWLKSVSQWIGTNKLSCTLWCKVVRINEILSCAAERLPCGSIGGLLWLWCWVVTWIMQAPTAAKQAKNSLAYHEEHANDQPVDLRWWRRGC
eukprot:518586-Amphidinium_carterae.2